MTGRPIPAAAGCTNCRYWPWSPSSYWWWYGLFSACGLATSTPPATGRAVIHRVPGACLYTMRGNKVSPRRYRASNLPNLFLFFVCCCFLIGFSYFFFVSFLFFVFFFFVFVV